MHKFVLLKQKNIMDIIIICKYNTEIYSAFRICDTITKLFTTHLFFRRHH